MRIILFFLYLCFVFLGIEQNSYANTPSNLFSTISLQSLRTDTASKFILKDQITNLIEETDFDSDEDQAKNDSKKNGSDSKIVILKSDFVSKWNQTLVNSSYLNYYNLFRSNATFGKQQFPLYIKNRVLRI